MKVCFFLICKSFIKGEAEKNGFPKLSEMAEKKQWWAVKNLVRRRVITDGEAVEKCNGRNALEWAVHHDEKEMAEELKYYFVSHFIKSTFGWLFLLIHFLKFSEFASDKYNII